MRILREIEIGWLMEISDKNTVGFYDTNSIVKVERC